MKGKRVTENGKDAMAKYDWHNYVRKERHDEFEFMCKKNCLDFYSCGVVLSSHLIMSDLYDGLTPKDAHDSAFKTMTGHSGASASMVISIVKHFSPRGEEFYKWYKEQEGH